jgi:L-lactate dehydrogenase complex protein LldE
MKHSQIQLFSTCLVDSLFPEVGVATVKLLTSCGITLQHPESQTCCGQPAMNAGMRSEALRMAKHTIEVFEQSEDPVVLPSGSCAGMLRHGYLELFAEMPEWLERASRMALRTYELSEFLVDELELEPIRSTFHGKLAYHPSCHLLRQLKVIEQPLKLLNSVEGAETIELAAECCGFGGFFSIEHSEISAEMLERRLEAIETTGTEMVVGCDVSCLMQIEGGLRSRGSNIRCAHIAQILSDSPAELR